jgi:hypothetical protein
MPTEKDRNQEYFKETILAAKTLLASHPEWVNRFKVYADKILANTQNIRLKKTQFHEWAPLYLYLNVGTARGASKSVNFSLRYHGQAVADLTVSDSVRISTAEYENKRDFNCETTCDCGWREKDANAFRKYFATNPTRQKTKDNKGNEEHRIESMFLTELSKKKGSIKNQELHGIQPVKIGGIARFQMATPLSASKSGLVYSTNGKGGGVDILARVGNGANTRICIMEVKDEYAQQEPPKKALAQGLAYATFVRELLRSPGGKIWWKIFGFSRGIPEHLTIYVASVMPFNPNGPSEEIIYDDLPIGDDKFKLHHVYFSEEGIIKSVKTSF